MYATWIKKIAIKCLIKNGIYWKNINSKIKMEIGKECGITYAAMSSWVGGWLSEYGHKNTQYIITIVISIINDVS